MKNIGMLYIFEIKKILKNRLTVAMLIVTFVFTLIEAVTPKLSMTGEMMDALSELDGRAIDDTLLQEMYPVLIENGTVWTAENARYTKIAEMEKGALPDDAVISDYSADEMYRAREEKVISYMRDDKLTDQEISWWEARIHNVDTPLIYRNYKGPLILAQGLSLTLMCIMLISALCLSTVFTVEHRQRTDQLIISCRNGRRETYFVKTAAGLSVIIACCLISAAMLTMLIAVIYGLDGLRSAVQLELPMSAYSLTFGRFIGIQMIVMVTASILFAAFAMAVSEVLKNSLAVTGVMVGLFIFGQLEIIPPRFRLLAQLNSMLPSNQISIWSLLEYRLVGTGGRFVTTFTASPVIYLLISALMIVIGRIAYDRFQVTGR